MRNQKHNAVLLKLNSIQQHHTAVDIYTNNSAGANGGALELWALPSSTLTFLSDGRSTFVNVVVLITDKRVGGRGKINRLPKRLRKLNGIPCNIYYIFILMINDDRKHLQKQ